MSNDNSEPSNFIRDIIDADLASGRHSSVVTRFPPEPNGYLHMGHAKSICLNFGLTQTYEGRTHLRFDDTNPTKEDIEYVESIQADIKWLGFDWGEHLYFSSDYFGRLYELAEKLIQDGNAYVCQLSLEDTRAYRGTLTEPGRPSPGRDRSAAENLELFRKMRDGGFAPGEAVLRAKVDMASPNMKMRDPLMYRILDAHHWRQGDTWKIYPLYDWTHGLSDSFEGVTHSIC
ncbi:MAG: glutaminyl-tRNA synthetase, partial [Myxococcota bacterium]